MIVAGVHRAQGSEFLHVSSARNLLPSPSPMSLARYLPDRFTVMLIAVVVAATLLPCRGVWAQAFHVLTTASIALLFFMHGAKLSREAIIAGVTHWRLHLLVFLCTFAMFPLLGIGLMPRASAAVGTQLALGLLFLCTLPSTVQSSIAFTSIARGNVAAALCAATASNRRSPSLVPSSQ